LTERFCYYFKGNYGLWDQLLAVEWVYENAHLFGGDRNRIVLAGHSAGAGNVMLIPGNRKKNVSFFFEKRKINKFL